MKTFDFAADTPVIASNPSTPVGVCAKPRTLVFRSRLVARFITVPFCLRLDVKRYLAFACRPFSPAGLIVSTR